MATKQEVRDLVIDHVDELRTLRADKRVLEERISSTQSEAIPLYKRLAVKSIAFDDFENPEIKITGTLVEATELIFDEVKLRKKVGAKNWNKITRRVLDKTLLEAAVAEGLISPTVLASCASEKPKTPYIRITEKRS